MDWIALTAEAQRVIRDENGVPVEWTLLKIGDNPLCQEGKDDNLLLTAEQMSEILDYHRKKGELIPLDSEHYLYELANQKKLDEHETLKMFPGGVAALGYGSLALSGEELRVKVKWTPAAYEFMKEKIYKYFSSAAAATVTTPEVTDYRTVRVSTANMPEVIRAAVRIPEVEVRIAGDNTIRILSPSGVVVVVPSAGGDVIAVPSPQGYRITLPEVRDPAARMPQLIALQKIQQTLFRDQRNLIYDSSIGIDSAVWAKWIRIYQADEPYDMPHVELTDGLRMIAEVTVSEDRAERETLNTNLERYVSLGYNAALLTFDTTEPLDSLVELAELIRSKGLAVWIAYSGPEDLRHSVFADPDRLANCVRTLAELSEGLVIGWRRTALHLFVQDRPFYNVILRAARAGNPKLQILGESYIGETAETPEYTRIAMFNNPANCSGTVVSGIGFYGVNVAGALAGVFKPVAEMNRVALIVGSRPYHMTLHRSGLSRVRQDAVKEALERRFRAAGCSGTITLHGDGGTVVENNIRKITDSLCRQ